MRTALTAWLLLAVTGLLTPEMSSAQTLPPPGGGAGLPGCNPVHEGCPSDPFIAACDSCFSTALRQKALLVANQEGFNDVYVVDRRDREVVHYGVTVYFTPTGGVNISAMDLGFLTERSQAIRAVLQEGADVHQWFSTDGKIKASDLEDAGIHVNHSSGFDFAADPNGTIDLEIDLIEYLNQELESVDEWQSTLDQFENMVNQIISKLAGAAIDTASTVTFEWPDGSTVLVKITVLVDATEATATIDVEIRPAQLRNANGELIHSELSDYGVDPDVGGTTDPIHIGNPSVRNDLLFFLNHMSTFCTTTELTCDASGVCMAKLSCN